MEVQQAYYWAKDPYGIDMLIIEVDGRRWNYGSLVLSAIERMMKRNPQITLDDALELERRHWEGLERHSLKKEFEILKQTPEYKKLINIYDIIHPLKSNIDAL